MLGFGARIWIVDDTLTTFYRLLMCPALCFGAFIHLLNPLDLLREQVGLDAQLSPVRQIGKAMFG